MNYRRLSPIFVALALTLYSTSTIAKPKSLHAKNAKESHSGDRATEGSSRDLASTHGMLLSGGIGLTFNPTTFLISPQLEFPMAPNLYLGPLIQIGVASGTFVTFSGAARYVLGHDPKLKPSIEGGLGLAIASGIGSAVGVNINIGMGLDYVVSPTVKVGTMLRLNFVPPITALVVTWPIVLARLSL